MKKFSLITAFLLLTTIVFAQNADLRRKIEVDGIVSKEITPDIINVNISLKEYMNGKTKISISDLERQIENAVLEAGIPKEDFTINSLSGYNNYYQKKKTPDFLASKQYSIRFHNLNKYNEILSKIDHKAIYSTNIGSYDHSKMPEIKKEMKIRALLAAKEKATYLLAAIGEKIGSPLSITESDVIDLISEGYSMRNMNDNATMNYEEDLGNSAVDVKRIKLHFMVKVVFEIK